MRDMKMLRLVGVVTLLSMLPGSVLADEAKCDHVITSAPYVINAQGHYCLGNNITYFIPTGAAITINANSVVLDLAGYKIGGQAAGLATQAYGVYVANSSNVVVKNGLIRGFFTAVQYQSYSGTSNNVVESIRADGNTVHGIYIYGGVYWEGSNNTVRNCQVSSTGGGYDPYVTGIYMRGSNSLVFNNTVTNTMPAIGETDGYGIIISGTGAVINNQVFGARIPNTDTVCFVGSQALYRDNIADGCTHPYLSGIDIGNNYP